MKIRKVLISYNKVTIKRKTERLVNYMYKLFTFMDKV